MSQFNFSISEAEAQETASWFDPLPAGWYDVVADEVSLSQNKAGTGAYIKVRFTVIGEKYRGRKVFTYINVQNQNAQAQEIGLANLRAFMVAIGLRNMTDVSQLANKPLQIRLRLKESRNGGDENQVNGYRAGQAAPQMQMPQVQMQMPAPVQQQMMRPPVMQQAPAMQQMVNPGVMQQAPVQQPPMVPPPQFAAPAPQPVQPHVTGVSAAPQPIGQPQMQAPMPQQMQAPVQQQMPEWGQQLPFPNAIDPDADIPF